MLKTQNFCARYARAFSNIIHKWGGVHEKRETAEGGLADLMRARPPKAAERARFFDPVPPQKNNVEPALGGIYFMVKIRKIITCIGGAINRHT